MIRIIYRATMRRVLIFIQIAVLITSCGPTAAGLQETLPTVTPLENDSAKAGGAAIIYQQSGGFAGISEKWEIYPDGRVVAGEDREFWITAGQVRSLIEELEGLGFFELEISGSLPGNCKDCFTYQITVRSEGKIHSIIFDDTAAEQSDQVWEIVERINNIIQSVSD